MYENGIGIECDVEKAIYWYKKAIDQEYSRAMLYLGILLTTNKKFLDYEQALKLLLKAEKLGEKEACYYIGEIYFSNNDLIKAINWYGKGAEAKDSNSQVKLGKLYETGLGVQMDTSKAFYWYNEAAMLNDDEAYFNLGRCYYLAIGTIKDQNLAIKYLKKASKEENGNSSYYLGIVFLEKENSNPNKAYNYFKLSIKQGSFKGYYGLAICYLKGIKVKKNIKKAAKNLYIALECGITDIYNLKEIIENNES